MPEENCPTCNGIPGEPVRGNEDVFAFVPPVPDNAPGTPWPTGEGARVERLPGIPEPGTRMARAPKTPALDQIGANSMTPGAKFFRLLGLLAPLLLFGGCSVGGENHLHSKAVADAEQPANVRRASVTIECDWRGAPGNSQRYEQFYDLEYSCESAASDRDSATIATLALYFSRSRTPTSGVGPDSPSVTLLKTKALSGREIEVTPTLLHGVGRPWGQTSMYEANWPERPDPRADITVVIDHSVPMSYIRDDEGKLVRILRVTLDAN